MVLTKLWLDLDVIDMYVYTLQVVGYFPIDGSHASATITGELKLGFQVFRGLSANFVSPKHFILIAIQVLHFNSNSECIFLPMISLNRASQMLPSHFLFGA